MNELLIVLNTERVKGVVYVMSEENLSEIIGQIRGGHPEAFNALYMETNNVVFFHAKSILKNEQDALDAVQDTYLSAFQKLDTLQEPKAAKQWLCGIASNICFNKLRKAKHDSGISLDDEVFLEPEAPETAMPEKVLDKNSTSEIVKSMIENLSEVQKLTVIMFYFDEMSIAQIAQTMECSENTVKSRLNYARKNIEGQVREEEKRGVKLYSASPTIIALALRFMAEQSPMPSGAVPTISSAIATGCGYSAALSAAAAGGITTGGAAAVTGSAVASGIGAKVIAIILAGTVVVGGAATGIVIHNRNQQTETPAIEEPLETAAEVEEQPEEATSGMSQEQAAAYYKLLNDIVSKNGICSSTAEGPGLAYAELIDFDGDGNEELYLYFTDDDYASVGESRDKLNPTGRGTTWILHEQVWTWDGSTVKKVFDEHQFNNGIGAIHYGEGRCLSTDGENILLVSVYEDAHGGYSTQRCSVMRLYENEFQTELETYEAFANGTAPEPYSFGSFYEGYIIRNGVTENFTAEQMNFVSPMNETQIGVVRAKDGGDSPGSLCQTYAEECQEKELIHNERYSQLSWETNDVQSLLNQLSSTGEPSLITETPSEDTGLDEKQRIDAYVEFVRTISAAQQTSSRFMLYDCDGDGYIELIALYQCSNPNYSPDLFDWACGEVYTLDSSGKLAQMYSSGLMSLVGAGNMSFYEVTYGGQTYLATAYSGGDSSESYGRGYRLMTVYGDILVETHNIKYDSTMLYNADGSTNESIEYHMDGVQITESAFREVEDSKKVLAALWGDDQCMSQNEFISFYG